MAPPRAKCLEKKGENTKGGGSGALATGPGLFLPWCSDRVSPPKKKTEEERGKKKEGKEGTDEKGRKKKILGKRINSKRKKVCETNASPEKGMYKKGGAT